MDPRFKLQKAQRVKCAASIMIEGLTGTGKSGLALLIARALTDDWKDIAAIDTENKSLDLFVGLKTPSGDTFKNFNVGQLTEDIGYKPSHYLAFREAAREAGAKACIFDSISHAWQYKGGILDLVTQAKTKNSHYARDQYAAWGDEEVVKEKNELFQLIRDREMHMITTVRVKEKMEYSVNAEGKTELISLGEQQIQQTDLKYEPDLVLHMIEPGSDTKAPKAKVIKTRYAFLTKGETYEFTASLLKQLKDYLSTGVDPEKLLEEQHKEYIKAVTEYLNGNTTKVSIWNVLKTDAGFKDKKLSEIPLPILKQLYIKLV